MVEWVGSAWNNYSERKKVLSLNVDEGANDNL